MKDLRGRLLRAWLVATVCVSGVCKAQDLLWESQGLTDEAAIPTGSVFNYNGTTVTLTWSITTDGGFATYPGGAGSTGGGDDYVTYEASTEGNHTGLVLMAFDNAAYDPDDYITLTLTFATAQSNLVFSLLDIDQDNWDDAVEVLYNGTGNARTFGQWSYAQGDPALRTVQVDNEGYYDGWEGVRDRADPTEIDGNINLSFIGIAVSTVQIRFFSTNDFGGDPGGQKIGISDLLVVTPEPSTALAGAVLLGAAAWSGARGVRRRRTDR